MYVRMYIHRHSCGSTMPWHPHIKSHHYNTILCTHTHTGTHMHTHAHAARTHTHTQRQHRSVHRHAPHHISNQTITTKNTHTHTHTHTQGPSNLVQLYNNPARTHQQMVCSTNHTDNLSTPTRSTQDMHYEVCHTVCHTPCHNVVVEAHCYALQCRQIVRS